MWVSGPQNDVDHVGMACQDRRQGLDDIFDALVGRQQAECQEHELPFDPKMVLVKARVDKRHIGNSVRNKVDLFLGNVINIAEETGPAMAHDHQAVRQGGQLVQNPALSGIRLAQNRV